MKYESKLQIKINADKIINCVFHILTLGLFRGVVDFVVFRSKFDVVKNKFQRPEVTIADTGIRSFEFIPSDNDPNIEKTEKDCTAINSDKSACDSRMEVILPRII